MKTHDLSFEVHVVIEEQSLVWVHTPFLDKLINEITSTYDVSVGAFLL